MISFDYYNKIKFEEEEEKDEFYFEKILTRVHGYEDIPPKDVEITYEAMKYTTLIEIISNYVESEKYKNDVCKYEYPLTSYVQFEGLEAPKLNVLFALMKYYNFDNIVERTMSGENSMIINDFEQLINTTEDMKEYNKINLMKRFAYILNYLTLVVYGVNENNTLSNLGYICPHDGIIVSSEFYNKNTMTFSDTKVCVIFDGVKVRVGRWSVNQLVERAIQNKTILYIAPDSIYPLSLCLEMHRKGSFEVITKQEMQQLYLKRGNKNAFVNMTMYDAIPGSGKTTQMKNGIDNHKQEALIIVPTKQERDELKQLGFNVYTADSIHHQLTNINGRRKLFSILKQIKSVHIDECFMLHSGQLQWLLLKIREIQKYTEICMYGDKGQIPYYSFVNVKCQYARMLQNQIKDVVTMNITHRCPGCIVPILREEYGREVYSSSLDQGRVETWSMPQDKLLRMLQIVGSQYKIITFTQAEKDILKSNHISAITIAESQGMTFGNVLLVRMNMYERTIYHSKTHILVAMTRFKNKFLYYTTVKDDLYLMIDKSKYNYKLSLGMIANMKLGEYIIAKDKTFDIVNAQEVTDDVFSNIIIANKYSNYVRSNTITNPLFVNSKEIIDDIDNNNDKNMLAMNKLLDEYSSKYPKNYIDKNEYLKLLLEKKETLETKNVKFNENKFTELLNKEILHYQNKSYYDIVRNCENGTFLLSNIPKSRYDEMDLLTLLSSIDKRNADPGKIRHFMMTMEPSKVIDNFRKMYVDEKKYSKLKQNIQQLSEDYLTEWKQTRTLQQLNKLQSEKENINKIDFTSYNSFVKTIYKNKFDETQYDAAQAAQIVAGAQALMVEFFTPMVKRFTQILKSIMKDNVLINDGVTAEYIEWFVNNNIQKVISDGTNVKVTPFEMDYSKFDKNQDWIDLYYQLLLLKEFGIEETILENWACVHLLTTLKFQKYKITMTTFTQRKSGDAFTFMGNTLFTMLMYSTFYDTIEPIVMLFGGDDSLILYDTKDVQRVQDFSDEIAAAFNMEIKYMDTNKSVMFASKLFVFHDNHVYVYPDILKQFSRYNRMVKTKEHAISQQISSFLINRNLFYASEELYNKYIDQLMNRYKLDGDAKELFTIVLNAYMQYVYVGKTYLMYKNFSKLPNANIDDMRKIRKKMQKKITLPQMVDYECKNSMENQFMQNYMCMENIDIRIGSDPMRREQININMLSPTDYHKVYDSFINAMRAYFDNNKLSYANLNIDIDNYVKYTNILNNSLNNSILNTNKNKNKNIIYKMLSIVSKPVMWLFTTQKEIISVNININQSLFSIVTFEEYVNNLEKIICNINYKMKMNFELHVNVLN